MYIHAYMCILVHYKTGAVKWFSDQESIFKELSHITTYAVTFCLKES